jgi:hypothetical protein
MYTSFLAQFIVISRPKHHIVNHNKGKGAMAFGEAINGLLIHNKTNGILIVKPSASNKNTYDVYLKGRTIPMRFKLINDFDYCKAELIGNYILFYEYVNNQVRSVYKIDTVTESIHPSDLRSEKILTRTK